MRERERERERESEREREHDLVCPSFFSFSFTSFPFFSWLTLPPLSHVVHQLVMDHDLSGVKENK